MPCGQTGFYNRDNFFGPGFLEKIYENALRVEDKVIIELKTAENIDKAHEGQLLNYLKATNLHVGLLANFKHKKADIKHMVFNLPEGHGS